MRTRSRYARFERVTGGAAARLLRVSRKLALAEPEVEFYLRELVLLDDNPASAAPVRLRRLALRRAPAGSKSVRGAKNRRAHKRATGARRCEAPAAPAVVLGGEGVCDGGTVRCSKGGGNLAG